MDLLFLAVFALYAVATVASLVCFYTLNKRLRTMVRVLLPVAAALHAVYLLTRFVISGHTPVASSHEAVSFFAWSLTMAYLLFRWRYRVKNFAAFVTPLIMLLMIVALASPSHVVELPPAMRSWWLPAHGMIALMANAFLALAFCGGVMYLLHEREIKRKRMGFFSERLPSLEALDNLNQHCLAIGFPLLTLGIISGSVWARQAWGAFWQWDPKETWSLVTWLIYASMMHQRFTLGWRRRRVAIMAILGFCAVLFTLWGVNLFLGGAHSYAR
ncbi:MAG TPA: c-type cytochrome biogenesis protein CcsB [Desulfurivibrio alkaliphilus]|uniref:C-type cytochrome biogenesis protein CcsB n=1 Tax=Desulfurivibrio alkaliphilus TaxID=427923 RepID=A0A7C2TFG7_9BACT|nr:c-type cytochrome biogenesis protein CcsB [Desulfurivibrio alkaliphilus]